jgi:hypothetical protein
VLLGADRVGNHTSSELPEWDVIDVMVTNGFLVVVMKGSEGCRVEY